MAFCLTQRDDKIMLKKNNEGKRMYSYFITTEMQSFFLLASKDPKIAVDPEKSRTFTESKLL